MPKPANYPDWATNPADPASAIVAPPPSLVSSGWSPTQKPPAQFFNHWKNLVGKWIRWLEEVDAAEATARANADDALDGRLDGLEGRIVDHEWTYPAAKDRSVLVPLQLALPYAVGGTSNSWTYGFDSAFSPSQRLWMGGVQGEILELPLGHLLPSGARPSSVTVLCKPPAARATTGNRVLVEVVRQTQDFGFDFANGGVPYANVPTATVLGSARDNGTEALQMVNVGLGGSQPLHDRHDENLFVRITAGVIGPRLENVVAVRFGFSDPGPRNG